MSPDETRVLTDADLHFEVSQFLFEEAALLDDRDYQGWLGLLTEDIVYRMPLRLSKERKDGDEIDHGASYFEDDLTSLTVRAARLGTRSAWSEDPPSRTRHFITNIVVRPGPAADELAVTSNLLFTRSRGSQPVNHELTGRRHDILRRTDGSWKLSRREVVLDQTVLGTLNLSSLY